MKVVLGRCYPKSCQFFPLSLAKEASNVEPAYRQVGFECLMLNWAFAKTRCSLASVRLFTIGIAFFTKLETFQCKVHELIQHLPDGRQVKN
jgi:hypothetical protein